MFKLYYNLRDNGDGSVGADFYQTEKEAEEAAENCEGFGEPCNGEITLEIIDGKIYYRQYSENWPLEGE